MAYWILHGILVGSLLLVTNASAGGRDYFFASETFLQSEPITVKGALNDWREGDYRGGEKQFASVWLETGVKQGDRAVSGLYRQEFQARFSPDTADYYYGTQHHQLDPERTYQLGLETFGFKAQGLRVQQAFHPADQLKLVVGGSLFHASSLQSGTLQGQAVTNGNGKDHDYQADIDYTYDQDRLLDRPDVDAPHGIGYALDANLHWKPGDRLEADLVLRDLLGEISWNNVPYTHATLTSDIKTVDSDGFTKIKAGLNGNEGYRDSLRKTLQPKADASIQYHLEGGKKTALLALKHVPGQTLWGMGGGMPALRGHLNTTVWPDAKMLVIEYEHKGIHVTAGIDNLNPVDANTVWLGLGLD